ncbi:MAG: GNAT family N-acetyltransferase [Paracoccaceae bacterium]|nr:GNAT family N-acetyltransferase [Paracoccaceae bacterium]
MTDTLVQQPSYNTQRLFLRPIRKSDAGLISVHAADVRVAQMTAVIPHPLPPGVTEAFIETSMSADRTEDVRVMDGSAQGHAEVIGLISLNRMDRGQSEIGYWVAPAFWGTGFASEALAVLIEANPHNNSRIFGQVFQDNPGSARVLMNAGFEYLGDAEAFCIARNAVVQTWTYSKAMEQ